MTSLLIHIYEFFRSHRITFYCFLFTSVAIIGYFALQVKFEEDVVSFLPDTEDAQNSRKVFNNLKIKDKIIVMFSAADSTQVPDAETFIQAATTFEGLLNTNPGPSHIKDIFFRADENTIGSISNFVYDNLPLFLTDDDYLRFDSLLTEEAIGQIMQRNYKNLLSPAGIAMKNYIMRDPLSLAGNALKHLQDFQIESNYELTDGYVFSKDGSTLFMFITPVFGTGSTGENDALITGIEEAITHINTENQQIQGMYFGGPSVGVYNARQIKKDTIVTGLVALVIIIIFISLVFKRKSAIPLIIVPALFGGLFALCIIYLIKGNVSAIAVGSGSVVLGIALSYSIHLLAHQNHVSTVQQLIREIAYPLTVGSFTTIGAFVALLFTSSELLRDFGLYASLVLVGTTLFCLIFLPHFLKGQAHVKQGKILRLIEKANSYTFEKNKWLIGTLVVLTVVCLFTSKNVGFNEDMMALNYEPKHIKEAENKLTDIFENGEKNVMFVSVGKDANEAALHYAQTNSKLDNLKEKGEIINYASVQRFFIPLDEQQKRLDKWNTYWTPTKTERVTALIEAEATGYKFRKGAFSAFANWISQPFGTLDYQSQTHRATNRLVAEWETSTDSLTMLITQVRLSENNKEIVYNAFQNDTNVVIFDRAYFTNKWVSAVNDDFYLILYISSFLVFFALLLSYGRIELTLMSFLPMLISWIIIIGIMGILGIQFNIVNIILATFIFGIGDDFSIFIMDGLLSRYRTGQKVLNSHKTAIFFAAFTMIVGMGALVFAKHPALQSISIISILGMVAVVLVSFTIQPIIFHIFIARPASKGLPPYTLMGLLRSGLLYLLFLVGCLILLVFILLLQLIPVKKKIKKRIICYSIHYCCRVLLVISTFVKKEIINPTGENFRKPAIIIANHQSFIDILMLLSFSPRIVMITKKWVWESPVFGAIIRYVDFYYAGEGYELSVETLKKKVDDGYSIVIFPEGTRTFTGKMKRFHKGAFYLSQVLKLDILPVLFYGNNRIISRTQPFNVRKGIIAAEVLPRIHPDDTCYGKTYQERTKSISAYMRTEYDALCHKLDNTDNPYYYETLIRNYIYKGPVEEWYMRIKVRMEKNYRLFNEIIPRQGQITDIGCGFGALCYMLGMLSDNRKLLGIDYDDDKIAVADHAWLKQNIQAEFICADALSCELPPSDVFILNDMLHYMSYDKQHALLTRCAGKLLPGGMIIVRDGNTSDKEKHKLTRFTELMSTRIIRFNKTTEKLCFTSDSQIREIAVECGMELEAVRNDKFTSNTIYLLRKLVAHE
ncbi:1-acyl-sn-glycerol-3-phosphate acyltransferase [Bacteroides sp. 519]|uniref:1-acyl-sn-glycerol-3-phosphate acyltransferase n=1 Tax=Bacteroides sp. 519 TaxID=2302937 RepID=UPI0013D3321A|nr:1-acyl-sn-glycerol-3-phosphate acyltransferase [Bacteroides sp. 519]NDV60704.1 methyltransferase domain-containing protein [Bacteroides sp. 519]